MFWFVYFTRGLIFSVPRQTVALINGQRGMATLKEIQMRLKSVSNIAKITKSMKMIASTKMAKAQRLMDVARVYGQGSTAFYTNAQVEPSQTRTLALAISSDRGLCGGIHSSISKSVKKYTRTHPDTKIAIVGMKAKPQIAREARDKIVVTFDQVAKAVPCWDECALIAEEVMMKGAQSSQDIDQFAVYYNQFRSVVAYECGIIYGYPLVTIKSAKGITAYEAEDEILENFARFNLANSVYLAVTEGYASEMASKRSAMENATKNAGEMITKMTLTYNRTRQAVITNELCDIITGASAL